MHFFTYKEILWYGAFLYSSMMRPLTILLEFFVFTVRLSSNAISSTEFCMNFSALSSPLYVCLWYLFFNLVAMCWILLRWIIPFKEYDVEREINNCNTIQKLYRLYEKHRTQRQGVKLHWSTKIYINIYQFLFNAIFFSFSWIHRFRFLWLSVRIFSPSSTYTFIISSESIDDEKS